MDNDYFIIIIFSDFFPYDQDPLRLIIRRAAKLPVGSSIISEFVPKAIAVDFGRLVPTNFSVKMTASGPLFSNKASDWLAAQLPANQKPC